MVKNGRLESVLPVVVWLDILGSEVCWVIVVFGIVVVGIIGRSVVVCVPVASGVEEAKKGVQ